MICLHERRDISEIADSTLGIAQQTGGADSERSLMTHVTITAAGVGDLVEVVGHRVGDAARYGEILEVLGEPTHPHFRVRWEDGRDSLLYAGSDIVISRPTVKT